MSYIYARTKEAQRKVVPYLVSVWQLTSARISIEEALVRVEARAGVAVASIGADIVVLSEPEALLDAVVDGLSANTFGSFFSRGTLLWVAFNGGASRGVDCFSLELEVGACA